MLDSARLIDGLPAPSETKQMKIISPGAPRSGTTSMGKALKLLGYNTYAGMAHNSTENRFPLWTEAVEAKFFGVGRQHTAEDFDKLLGPYEAITGFPAAIFVEELFAAYPDAKFILTERDAASYIASWNRTVMRLHKSWQNWTWLLPLCRGTVRDFRLFVTKAFPAWSYGHLYDQDEQRKFYLDHNRRVHELIPEDRLLVWRPGDAWEPLCAFLGQQVPETKYPHSANHKSFTEAMDGMWRKAVIQAARNVAISVVVSCVVIGIVLRYL